MLYLMEIRNIYFVVLGLGFQISEHFRGLNNSQFKSNALFQVKPKTKRHRNYFNKYKINYNFNDKFCNNKYDDGVQV
jgi:hypothetical protein